MLLFLLSPRSLSQILGDLFELVVVEIPQFTVEISRLFPLLVAISRRYSRLSVAAVKVFFRDVGPYVVVNVVDLLIVGI